MIRKSGDLPEMCEGMRLPKKAVIETASCAVRMFVSNGSVFCKKTDFFALWQFDSSDQNKEKEEKNT